MAVVVPFRCALESVVLNNSERTTSPSITRSPRLSNEQTESEMWPFQASRHFYVSRRSHFRSAEPTTNPIFHWILSAKGKRAIGVWIRSRASYVCYMQMRRCERGCVCVPEWDCAPLRRKYGMQMKQHTNENRRRWKCAISARRSARTWIAKELNKHEDNEKKERKKERITNMSHLNNVFHRRSPPKTLLFSLCIFVVFSGAMDSSSSRSHFFHSCCEEREQERRYKLTKTIFGFIHSYHTWKTAINKNTWAKVLMPLRMVVPVYLNIECIRILFHFSSALRFLFSLRSYLLFRS